MNANDELSRHTGTDNYYQHNFGLVYTDGIKAFCDRFQCYWFIYVIVSYQPTLKNEEFQVWSLGKNEDSSAVVICTDGDNKVLASQDIPFTDFEADECTVWVECGVILLPSER